MFWADAMVVVAKKNKSNFIFIGKVLVNKELSKKLNRTNLTQNKSAGHFLRQIFQKSNSCLRDLGVLPNFLLK
jgi:predicted ribosome-associated RNA-binding protein Tma20